MTAYQKLYTPSGCCTVAEKEEREREMEERKAAACMTKAALRARLSLREMIDLGRQYFVA